MKNITISKKLLILIVVSVLALITTSLTANIELTKSQDRFNQLQYEVIPSIIVLNEASSDSAAMRAAVRDYIIGGFIEDQSLQSAQKENYIKLKDKINSNLNKYEKEYLFNTEDKQLLENDRKALNAYLTEVEDVFKKVEAKDISGISKQFSSTGSFRITAVDLIKNFNNHANFNLKYADDVKVTGEQAHDRATWFLYSQGIITLILLLVISYTIAKGIKRSLTSIQNAIDNIEGNLDFTKSVEVIGKDEISNVALALNRLVDKLRNSFKTISEGSNKISEAAEHLSSSSIQVADASATQSDSAASMAASMEELTVSINHVSDKTCDTHNFAIQSGQYSKSSTEAITESAIGIKEISKVASEVADEIHTLDTESEKITIVVSVIKDVAEQTNLLALNAAIEAARAGDHGIGFAVVADEVRKLAERTAKSTIEINEMVASIRHRSSSASLGMNKVTDLVKQGIQEIETTLETISRVETSSNQIMLMTDEVNASIREQSQASNLLAGNVEHIAQIAEENSAVAKNTSKLASELDKLSHELSDVVKLYKV